VKKNDLLAKIAKLVNEKKIEGISEIRDESDRTGMRVVFELRKDANAQIVLNQLFKRSSLEVSYGIIFLALVKNEPKLLNLKEMLQHYLTHRKEVVVNRTKYELRKAEERAHILEGLKIALDFIDEVIKIIRKSKDVDIARTALIKRFKLTEVQANAILDMRLQKITSLETQKIIEELEELKKKMKQLKALLKSTAKILDLIREELQVIKKKFGIDRMSEVSNEGIEDLTFDTEDLIANESEVITLSEGGYIRRVPLDTFKRQHRGGKGVISGGKREDSLKMVVFCKSHDFVLLFSNRGKIFYLKAYEVPGGSKDSRGKNLKGLVSLSTDEYITTIKTVPEFSDEQFLLLVTRRGIIKKLAINQIQNAKKGGIIALHFKNNKEDWLIDVAVVAGKDDIIMATSKGLALRTNLARMRGQGRAASGIIGMNLAADDYMAAVDVVRRKKDHLLVVTSNGSGKRVKLSQFATKGRGGKGMVCVKLKGKQRLVSARTVSDDNEAIITTKSGMTLRIPLKGVSVQGRTAGGVKVLGLSANDEVVDITVFSTE